MHKYYLILLFVVPLELFAQPYVRGHSITYSEPTSIRSFLNKFDGEFQGGEDAFTHNWLETGFRKGDWEMGILARYDYDITFSEDLAELYNMVVNKLPLPTGQRYELQLEAKHYRTHGLRLGYHLRPMETLQLVLGLSYLRGNELTDGTISGEAKAVSENDYDFNFHSDYYYSKDYLFEREVNSPKGWGYSIDLQVNWQPTEKLSLDLEVKDLLGSIYWDQAPNTIADASSDNKTFDEDGYVKFNPTLSGWEGYDDFTQHLNAFGSVAAQYAVLDRLDMAYEAMFTHQTYFWGMGMGYKPFHEQRVSVIFFPEINTLELGYSAPYWQLKLASDTLSIGDANFMHISGHLSLPL